MSDLENYIIEQFKIAKSDYILSRSEEERFSALRDLWMLKILAVEKVGFEFADSLDKL